MSPQERARARRRRCRSASSSCWRRAAPRQAPGSRPMRPAGRRHRSGHLHPRVRCRDAAPNRSHAPAPPKVVPALRAAGAGVDAPADAERTSSRSTPSPSGSLRAARGCWGSARSSGSRSGRWRSARRRTEPCQIGSPSSSLSIAAGFRPPTSGSDTSRLCGTRSRTMESTCCACPSRHPSHPRWIGARSPSTGLEQAVVETTRVVVEEVARAMREMCLRRPDLADQPARPEGDRCSPGAGRSSGTALPLRVRRRVPGH